MEQKRFAVSFETLVLKAVFIFVFISVPLRSDIDRWCREMCEIREHNLQHIVLYTHSYCPLFPMLQTILYLGSPNAISSIFCSDGNMSTLRNPCPMYFILNFMTMKIFRRLLFNTDYTGTIEENF